MLSLLFILLLFLVLKGVQPVKPIPQPSSQPSAQPSRQPSSQPSSLPSSQPTSSCRMGYYLNNNVCIPCEEGYMSNSTHASSCFPCPSGSIALIDIDNPICSLW